MKQYYNEVIEVLLHTEAIKATKYISSKEIVRGVRKSYRFNGRKHIKGENVEITLTIGKPNYIEREFIKECQKANEPFPVKKVQLKFPTFSKPVLNSGRPKKAV